MAKRRKRKRWEQDQEWAEARSGRRGERRNKRSRQLDGAGRGAAHVVLAEPEQRPKPALTCYQCAHLVITRSLVKHVSQSWDHAIVYPTLSCFQQRWTLEDPDSVQDHSSVSEFLVGGADRCPDFSRGYPRNHHDW